MNPRRNTGGFCRASWMAGLLVGLCAILLLNNAAFAASAKAGRGRAAKAVRVVLPVDEPTPASLPKAADLDTYSMSRAVAQALEENFTISAAMSEAMASESGRKSVRGSFGPALGTTYGYQHYQHRKTAGSTRERDRDLYTWQVWLRQNVFSGFATLSSYQKAVLQKDNADSGIAKARLELIGTVQENFLRLLQARENVRNAEDSLKRLSSQLKVTKAFYEVGLKPRLDVLQAEVDVATAEDFLLQTTNTYETQVSRLNTLLVLPVEGATSYTGSLDFIPFTRSFEDCLEIALRKRPDLIMATKAVAIAGKDVTIARSGFYPKIDAQGTWSSQGDTPSAARSDILTTHYNEWTFGVSGEWNAFQWGTTYHGVQQAKQTKNRLQAEENNLRQEVTYDIKARLLKLSEAAKRIKVAQKGLEQAKEAYRMADALYQAQAGIFIDVLDAQSKLTQAEAALTGAQAEYLIAFALIHVAIGEENPALLPIQ